MNTKTIGDATSATVLAALLRQGKTVLVPYGDNERYDLVIDEGGKFVTVQCKTGRLKGGAVVFKSCSSYAHRGRGKRDYVGEVDLFGVYCPETRKVYMVPVGEVGRAEGYLRVEPTRNRQVRRVTMAATEFEVPT